MSAKGPTNGILTFVAFNELKYFKQFTLIQMEQVILSQRSEQAKTRLPAKIHVVPLYCGTLAIFFGMCTFFANSQSSYIFDRARQNTPFRR